MLFSLCFSGTTTYAQTNIFPNTQKTKKDNIAWSKFFKSTGLEIEHSFQEDNPTSGYRSEYIVFRVTNNSKKDHLVSWDFSCIDQDDKCINCKTDNKELHFEAVIPANSYSIGNASIHNKGVLTIFNRFTDENYNGKSKIGWKSFDLKNLTIK